jgi:hypothetical protein
MRASEIEGSRDLFLSHSSTNKPLVRKIAADVQAHQRADGTLLTVWLDEAEIRPGQSVPGAVNTGLAVSRFFALLMSPAYFSSGSGWTDAEWHAVLHADPDNRRGRILPVLIADCPTIPPLLRHLRFIDMREPRYEEGLREILSILRDDEPQPSATIYKGQLIRAGRRLARETLVAERAPIDAEPAPATEFLSCNLLPVERPPSSVYTAPIATSLRVPRLDGSRTVPLKSLVKQVMHDAQKEAGRKSFTPAFRIVGEEIVTFHDLEVEDGVFAPVIDRDRTVTRSAFGRHFCSSSSALDGGSRRRRSGSSGSDSRPRLRAPARVPSLAPVRHRPALSRSP